jgi:hypothetical protein
MEIISADHAPFSLDLFSEIHSLLAAWHQGVFKLHFSRVKMKSLMDACELFVFLPFRLLV